MAYTIIAGDTLSNLAAKNKTDVASLMKANPSITDPNKIKVGQTLNIPTQIPMGLQTTFPGNTPPTNTQKIFSGKDVSTFAGGTPLASKGGPINTDPNQLAIKPNPTNTNTQQIFAGQNVSQYSNPVQGKDINALQNDLVNKGYMTKEEVATGPGIYGPKTQAAEARMKAGLPPLGQSNTGSTGSTTPTGSTGGFTQEQFNKPVDTTKQISTPQTTTDTTKQATPQEQQAQNTYAGLLQQAAEAQKRYREMLGTYNTNMNEITKQSIPLQFVQGQQGAMARDFGNVLQQTGLQAQQAVDLAGKYAPVTQFGVLTSPVTGQPVSGDVGGAISMGANVASIQEGTQKLNNLDQQSAGAKNNLSLAINVAKQGGLNNNVPILNTLQNNLGANFATNPTYVSLQAQINSVKNAYAAMGIDAGIPDWNNVSIAQLEYLQQTLDKNIANTRQGIQANMDKLKSGMGGQSTAQTPSSASALNSTNLFSPENFFGN